MKARFTVQLDGPESETTVAAVGGKGANLAVLVRAGFPVPAGFVIGTDAFRAFMRTSVRPPALRDRDRWTGDASLERLAGAIRRHPDERALLSDIEQGIRRAYAHLAASAPAWAMTVPGPLAVAVRSSATVEDLAEMSFAGGQQTFLNVRGEAALIEAVVGCWSSLWSGRALSYLERHEMDPGRVAVAVVVQLMVPADRSGVLFTADPVTGRGGHVVINAAWGLGEAVVNGRVTPDTAVVDAATRAVTVTVGDKDVMSAMTADGTAERDVEPRRRTMPVLDIAELAALADVGLRIEAHIGCAQDIEWSLADGRIHILQARPITGSADPGRGAPEGDDWPAIDEMPPQRFDLWTRVNVGEIWPDPVSPLVWSAVPYAVGTTTRHALRGLRDPYLRRIQWARRFHGRVYYNEGAFTYLFSHALGLPASVVDRALGSQRGASQGGDERYHPLRLAGSVPFALRFGLRQLRAGRQLTRLIGTVDGWLGEVSKPAMDGLTDEDLWRGLAMWIERFISVMKVNTAVSVSSFASFGLLERLTRDALLQGSLAHDLVTGLSGVHTAEMGQELARLADHARSAGLADVVLAGDPVSALATLRDSPQAAGFVQMLDGFLARHGHHCLNEGEWLYPRWVDAPERVIEVIAGYVRAGEEITSRTGEQARRREAALGYAKQHLNPVTWLLFRLVLGRVRHLIRLRDAGKNCYTKLLYPIRLSYVSLSERWTRAGWLRTPDDIFFLAMPEVEQILAAGGPGPAGLDITGLVDRRRQVSAGWLDVVAPDVIDADGKPIADPTVVPQSDLVIQGIPVSSGQVRGVIRVVRSPADAHLLRGGDILVTRATDPGWTPLFPLISGLIVEIGGQLSHAAIVAREYGLPAVANIGSAAQRLRTGQIVTVDGTTGRIYLDGADHESEG